VTVTFYKFLCFEQCLAASYTPRLPPQIYLSVKHIAEDLTWLEIYTILPIDQKLLRTISVLEAADIIL